MKTITKELLSEKLQRKEPLVLVDVREPAEHDEFNIGGISLPLGKIQVFEIDAISNFKNEEVICYCRSGMRSGNACMILQQLGFTNVSNLVGGMLEWQK